MANLMDDLRQLLAEPRESLGVEIKQWIDPCQPEGIAKIARACIALRNNNGGRLIIGFNDDSTPDKVNVPSDVKGAFHVDVIQQIVSRYSAELFPIEVQFVERDKRVYPVIIVPSGVKSPVAVKADLKGTGNKVLLRDHAIYVRTLGANNSVSSAEARRGDWDTLTRICFDNREADIGGFVRRHLSGLTLESLASLIPALASLGSHPTRTERVVDELDRGRNRFDAAIHNRGVNPPRMGFREELILIDGDFPEQKTTEEFRRNLLLKAPQHTGWPPWNEVQRDNDRPYVLDKGWEALIVSLDAESEFSWPHLDFWRIEPGGVFYSIRAIEDDLIGDRGPKPGTQLDFLLQIARTAEVISIGLSFGRTFGCDETTTSLIFGFRWTGLTGRRLTSWAEPMRAFSWHALAIQDQVTTVVTVPLDTPPGGIYPHVENAVRDLFTVFGGKEFHSNVIEEIVSKHIK